MQRIGAAAADDVDLACAEPVLRRIRTAFDFELLNRILGEDHGRRHQRLIGVNQPVQRVVVPFRPATVDAHRVALALPHGALLAAHGDGAGADQQQLHKIAPVERQVFHLVLAHQLRQRRCVRIQSHRLARYRHGLRNRSRFQCDVDSQILIDCQRQSVRYRLLESLDLRCDRIAAWDQRGRQVITRRTRSGHEGQVRGRVGYRYFDIGDDGPRAVRHRTQNRSRRACLPKRHRGRQQENEPQSSSQCSHSWSPLRRSCLCSQFWDNRDKFCCPFSDWAEQYARWLINVKSNFISL